MKRLLVYLLMMLLPLQSAWAATGAFCGNMGQPAAVQAEGHDHHAHEGHETTVTESADPAAQGTCTVPDGHCAACHAGFGAANGALVPMVAATSDTPDTFLSTPLTSPARQRPERPKWARLA